MAKCKQCNGSNYDEWWMCADCYRAISFKELEQLKRESIKDFIKWAIDVGYLYANLTLEDYEKMYFKQANKKDSHE